MRKHVILAAFLTTAIAAPAVAQEKGTIEFGGFAKYTSYDKSFGISNKRQNSYGGGARLGYFLSSKWALELDGSINATDVKNFFAGYESTALVYTPIHLRLNFNKKLGDGPFTWILGAGPAYNRYGKRVVGEPGFHPAAGGGSDFGFGVLTGFRAMLTNWLAFRLDGTLDYIPSPNNGKAVVVAQGIQAASAPSSNTNLGVQAGLSLMLGMCNKSGDGTTISPTTATVVAGRTQSFSATATNCGKPDEVVYSVSGPGSVSAAGVYTAPGTGPGTATVTACGRKNKLCSIATVTIPPPEIIIPPRTLARCELNPATSSPRIDQPVSYTVTLFYSDGSTGTLPNPVIVAAGGSVSGNSVSWSTGGPKTITVNCGTGAGGAAVIGSATADVRVLPTTVVRDSVFFMIDSSRIYRPDDQTSLDEVAKVLTANPEIRLVIDGHTDSDASIQHNDSLGMRRATSMREYLRSRGVPVDRMTIFVRSFGECVPVATNVTAEGRTKNRRAELREAGNETPGRGNAVCAESARKPIP